jgi:hypothetical protein
VPGRASAPPVSSFPRPSQTPLAAGAAGSSLASAMSTPAASWFMRAMQARDPLGLPGRPPCRAARAAACRADRLGPRRSTACRAAGLCRVPAPLLTAPGWAFVFRLLTRSARRHAARAGRHVVLRHRRRGCAPACCKARVICGFADAARRAFVPCARFRRRAGVLLPIVVPPIRELLTVPVAKAPPSPGQARAASRKACSARARPP